MERPGDGGNDAMEEAARLQLELQNLQAYLEDVEAELEGWKDDCEKQRQDIEGLIQANDRLEDRLTEYFLLEKRVEYALRVCVLNDSGVDFVGDPGPYRRIYDILTAKENNQ